MQYASSLDSAIRPSSYFLRLATRSKILWRANATDAMRKEQDCDQGGALAFHEISFSKPAAEHHL
jgi:hypothetical protein